MILEKDLAIALSLVNPKIRVLLKNVLVMPETRSLLSPAAYKIIDHLLKSGEDPVHPASLAPLLDDYNEREKSLLINEAASFASIEEPSSIESFVRGVVLLIQKRRLYAILEKDLRPLMDKNDIEGLLQRVSQIGNLGVAHFTPKSLGEFGHLLSDEAQSERTWKPFFTPLRQYLSSGGYIPGEVVVIAGATGRGKTMFSLSEAINLALQGAKVLYIALGDMLPKDFIYRTLSVYYSHQYLKGDGLWIQHYISDPGVIYSSSLSSILPQNLKSKALELWEKMDDRIKSNLEIHITEPDRLSVEDIYQTLQHPSYQDVDVVVVDYDSNLRATSNSMYERGEEIYEGLVRIARSKYKSRLVLVVSQVSKLYYGHEYVPLEALAESSRKQAIADIILTIGRNAQDADFHRGAIGLVKNRRGSLARLGYLMLPTGYFLHHDASRGILETPQFGDED